MGSMAFPLPIHAREVGDPPLARNIGLGEGKAIFQLVPFKNKPFSHCIPEEYSPWEAQGLVLSHGYPGALPHSVTTPIPRSYTFQEYPMFLLLTPTPEQGQLFHGIYPFAGADRGTANQVRNSRPLFPVDNPGMPGEKHSVKGAIENITLWENYEGHRGHDQGNDSLGSVLQRRLFLHPVTLRDCFAHFLAHITTLLRRFAKMFTLYHLAFFPNLYMGH